MSNLIYLSIKFVNLNKSILYYNFLGRIEENIHKYKDRN